jgi:deuterolysin
MTDSLTCNQKFGYCRGGVIAYTVISTGQVCLFALFVDIELSTISQIYFCDIFFSQVPTPSLCTGTTVESRNIRGGTTLHEVITLVQCILLSSQ